MIKVGDIRAFVDSEDRAVYGRVLAEANGMLAILDTTGAFYVIYEDDTVGVGEKTAEGEMLMASSRIAYEVSLEIEPYLEDPMVELVTKRLVGGGQIGHKTPAWRTDRASIKRERDYHAYESIPLRMFSGRELDLSGKPKMTRAMEKYLFSSDERRARFDGLLRRLKERAKTQWLMYVAVEMRGMTQAAVCRAAKLDDGNASKAYHAGKTFIDTYMGWNVAGA